MSSKTERNVRTITVLCYLSAHSLHIKIHIKTENEMILLKYFLSIRLFGY